MNQSMNSCRVPYNRQRMTLKIKQESMRQLNELARNMKCSRTAAIEEYIQFFYKGGWVEKKNLNQKTID
ncbi:CopG family transcriptional regulator [Priestia endophytica]|uniref:ribbon-helix-helix domain-containing protein n=1 Tax=Priestia endophytica TaxID=135735 RepID=UPI002E24E945|nr:ribbon-helix-helix domain-containing protein [Priestia endophytica]